MHAYIENIYEYCSPCRLLSPMIPAQPSNSFENLLRCICGLMNKTVLHIRMYTCMHHKASGGVARTLRYGQKLYFGMLLKQYFSTDIIISTYEFNKMSKKQNKYNVAI